MTDESICARCAELIRVRVRRHSGAIVEKAICGEGAIDDYLMATDTVGECSRFAEVPGEEDVG